MIIPPLERHFNLMGADVRGWFEEMPKPQKVENVEKQPERKEAASPLTARRRSAKKSSGLKIDQHFASNVCLVCETITTEGEPKFQSTFWRCC
jgi:DNA polymerase zeta